MTFKKFLRVSKVWRGVSSQNSWMLVPVFIFYLCRFGRFGRDALESKTSGSRAFGILERVCECDGRSCNPLFDFSKFSIFKFFNTPFGHVKENAI